jgi:hypothetical protein
MRILIRPVSGVSVVSPLRLVLSLALGGALVMALTAPARAQEPVDSDAWRSRCLALNAAADAINKGFPPPALMATPKDIPGIKFAAVAHERSLAGQHYIACTMYYTAAIAERLGNGGKIDLGKAHTDVFLGGVELKRSTGQALSFKEKMQSTSDKVTGSSKAGTLSPVEIAAVFAAFSDARGGPVKR